MELIWVNGEFNGLETGFGRCFRWVLNVFKPDLENFGGTRCEEDEVPDFCFSCDELGYLGSRMRRGSDSF